MNLAIADVLVTGYESLIDTVSLPDPDDRHVLAAAIRAGAQVIVTWNLKDFPAEALAPFGVRAVDPDDFVLEMIDLAPAAIASVVTTQAAALKNPPMGGGPADGYPRPAGAGSLCRPAPGAAGKRDVARI
jgi:hypothetical protein